MESRMPAMQTCGLTRRKPHRWQHRGAGLCSTKRKSTASISRGSTRVVLCWIALGTWVPHLTMRWPGAMSRKTTSRSSEVFVASARMSPSSWRKPATCTTERGGYSPRFEAMDRFARRLYDRLNAEGWKKLYYLPKDGMYGDDSEGAVAGDHPNDLGMKTMAIAFGMVIRKALGLNDDRRCGE